MRGQLGERLTSTLKSQLCAGKAASMSAESVMRHWGLPTGVSCNYTGVWDGRATEPMADPLASGGGVCVFRWSAVCFSPSRSFEVRVAYDAVRSKMEEVSSPPVAPPSELASALNDCSRMQGKLRVAAEVAAAKWNAREGPRADCCYLGQLTGRGLFAGHIASLALWIPAEQGRKYTVVSFRWTVRAGDVIAKDVQVSYHHAVSDSRGVCPPRWWSVARRVDAVFRRVDATSCYRGRRGVALPCGAAVSCQMLGSPKLLELLTRSDETRRPGRFYPCANSAGDVAEHTLVAQVQGDTWRCAADWKPWEAVARNADCEGFLVERHVARQSDKEMVTACEKSKSTEALKVLTSSSVGETSLEARAARRPIDTATILALGTWHAEVVRSRRAHEPNGVGRCFPEKSVTAAGFESKPWRWPVAMQRLNASVWSSWCVRAHRDVSICDASWFVHCTALESLLAQGRPPIPEGLKKHVVKAPTPWTPIPAHGRSQHSWERAAETSTGSQSDADVNDEAKYDPTAKPQEGPKEITEPPSKTLLRKRAAENDVVSGETTADDTGEPEHDEEFENDTERKVRACWELALENIPRDLVPEDAFADPVRLSPDDAAARPFGYVPRGVLQRLVRNASMDKPTLQRLQLALDRAVRPRADDIVEMLQMLPPSFAQRVGIPASQQQLHDAPVLALHEYKCIIRRFEWGVTAKLRWHRSIDAAPAAGPAEGQARVLADPPQVPEAAADVVDVATGASIGIGGIATDAGGGGFGGVLAAAAVDAAIVVTGAAGCAFIGAGAGGAGVVTTAAADVAMGAGAGVGAATPAGYRATAGVQTGD